MSTIDEYNRKQLRINATERSIKPQMFTIECLVRCAQWHLGLTNDGMCGPETERALYAWKDGVALSLGLAPAVDKVKAAGALAVEWGLALWSRVIHDPKHTDKSGAAALWRVEIDRIIRANGWGWLPPYQGDGAKDNPEWCGFFVGKCYEESIALDVRQAFFPSCWRLDTWARGGHLDNHKNAAPDVVKARGYLKLDAASKPSDVAAFCGTGPQPGDIGLVGDGTPDYGDHVILVTGWDPVTGILDTVEGNGRGSLPGATRGHGVVRAERPIGKRAGHAYHVRRLIRPAPADLL